MKVAVVDLSFGNTGSILNILSKLKVKAAVTADGTEIAGADKVILAGVGAYDSAMQAIRDRNLEGVLHNAAIVDKKPLLGICLGMQLLANGSEEGELPGLGFIPGRVIRFNTDAAGNPIRVPHMGWNRLAFPRVSPLASNLPERSRFYFMHSYYYVCDDPADVAATTSYGVTFASMVQKGNIMGTQFHPEKSHRYGMALFQQFARL